MAHIPVTVYHVGPTCVQCTQTKRTMDKLGIRYTEVDLRDHPEIMETFKAQGHLTAPIVTTDIKTWSGFRLSKIQGLANYLRSQQK
jgi:glutaredoxin-like protein NrdH